MRRALLAFGVVLAMGTAASPAAARHTDRHCTLTVHHPLGTDDVPLPEQSPVDELDIGFVKIFVNCHHGHRG